MGRAARRGPLHRAVRALFAVGAVLAVIATFAAWDAASVPLGPLGTLAPFPTALMRAREAEAGRLGRPSRIDFHFVPYDRISPLLRRAVLVAEDDAFFQHGGLDWNEIEASARRNLERGHIVRGGSTITQQLARNLFLGEERTITRKLKEVVLALRIERAVSKRRILELYLNLIEWGDGIYGVEAAAEHYFGTNAGALDARQALLLACVIINPRRFSPLAPTQRIEARVRTIAGRMLRRGQLSDAEYRLAVGEAPPAAEAGGGGEPGSAGFEAPEPQEAAVDSGEGAAAGDTAGRPPVPPE